MELRVLSTSYPHSVDLTLWGQISGVLVNFWS